MNFPAQNQIMVVSITLPLKTLLPCWSVHWKVPLRFCEHLCSSRILLSSLGVCWPAHQDRVVASSSRVRCPVMNIFFTGPLVIENKATTRSRNFVQQTAVTKAIPAKKTSELCRLETLKTRKASVTRQRRRTYKREITQMVKAKLTLEQAMKSHRGTVLLLL